jgi:hypothetical protein
MFRYLRVTILVDRNVCRRLGSFASALPAPCRGYALVRPALDLGLRGIEIGRLQLTGIEWPQGTFTRKRTESRRKDLLPLPTGTGCAMEVYPRHEPAPWSCRTGRFLSAPKSPVLPRSA